MPGPLHRKYGSTQRLAILVSVPVLKSEFRNPQAFLTAMPVRTHGWKLVAGHVWAEDNFTQACEYAKIEQSTFGGRITDQMNPMRAMFRVAVIVVMAAASGAHAKVGQEVSAEAQYVEAMDRVCDLRARSSVEKTSTALEEVQERFSRLSRSEQSRSRNYHRWTQILQADLQCDAGDSSGALARCWKVLEELYTEPGTTESLPVKGQALLIGGDILYSMGEYPLSVDAYTSAILVKQKYPEAMGKDLDEARLIGRVAQAMVLCGLPSKPLEMVQKCLNQLDVNDAAEEAELRSALLAVAGQACAYLSENQKAADYFRESYKFSKMALQGKGASVSARIGHASVCLLSVPMLIDTGETTKAQKLCEEAIAELGKLRSVDSQSFSIRSSLAGARTQRAALLQETGNYSKACEEYQWAASEFQQMAEVDRFNLAHKVSALECLVGLVECSRKLGREAEAQTALASARRLYAELPYFVSIPLVGAKLRLLKLTGENADEAKRCRAFLEKAAPGELANID